MKFLCTECLSNNSLHLSIFISFKYLNVQKSEVIIKVENVLSMMYLTVSDPRGINYIFDVIDFTFTHLHHHPTSSHPASYIPQTSLCNKRVIRKFGAKKKISLR